MGRTVTRVSYLACLVAGTLACGEDGGGASDTGDTSETTEIADTAGDTSADTAVDSSADTSADSAADTADTAEADTTPAPTSMVFEVSFDIDSVDPAISYFGLTWQYEYVTCAMLLNYADTDEATLVPEIAAAMPEVSADGLTYTFEIRSGFTLSPPSGEVVTAETVKRTFERAMDPELDGPAQYFMGDVVAIEVGGAAEDELTITLAAPAGDFMSRLAMPFFCVVPSDTPHSPADSPVPTAGPYYMASYTPVTYDDDGDVTTPGEIVFLENPAYQGSRPRVVDEIRYVTGIDEATSLARVVANEVDYLPVMSPPPQEDRAALIASFGPGSADPRLFTYSGLGYRYLTLNHSRPVFARANTRLAVQYAVDRAALGQAQDLSPNDDYLPPGVPGYAGDHPYPIDGADREKALELLGGEQPEVVFYVAEFEGMLASAALVEADLEAVGFQVTLETFAPPDFFATLGDPDAEFDLAIVNWFADYPDPFNFLNVLLGQDFDLAASHFDDPVLQERLTATARLLGDERIEAYRQLDRDLMAASPLAVLGNPTVYAFFSERIGCRVLHPLYGYNLAALCIE